MDVTDDMDLMMGNLIDENLVDILEKEAESAFRSLNEMHPGEHFYIASINFDRDMTARFSAFSEEALERAFQEQEITSERERDWYRNVGSDALCTAYDYEIMLTESNRLLEKRKQALPEGTSLMPDMTVCVCSAGQAIERLQKKGLFGEQCVCMAKVSLRNAHSLPPGGLQ